MISNSTIFESYLINNTAVSISLGQCSVQLYQLHTVMANIHSGLPAFSASRHPRHGGFTASEYVSSGNIGQHEALWSTKIKSRAASRPWPTALQGQRLMAKSVAIALLLLDLFIFSFFLSSTMKSQQERIICKENKTACAQALSLSLFLSRTHVHVCQPRQSACWRCLCACRNTLPWPPHSHSLSVRANRHT